MLSAGTILIADQDPAPSGYKLSTEDPKSPFHLEDQTVHVTSGLALDHERHPDVRIEVKVTELDTGLSLVQTLQIKVTDVAEEPCCLTVDGQVEKDIVDRLRVGQVVGHLEVKDQDEGDQHTYRLVTGHGFDVDYFR